VRLNDLSSPGVHTFFVPTGDLEVGFRGANPL